MCIQKKYAVHLPILFYFWCIYMVYFHVLFYLYLVKYVILYKSILLSNVRLFLSEGELKSSMVILET